MVGWRYDILSQGRHKPLPDKAILHSAVAFAQLRRADLFANEMTTYVRVGPVMLNTSLGVVLVVGVTEGLSGKWSVTKTVGSCVARTFALGAFDADRRSHQHMCIAKGHSSSTNAI